MRQLILSLSFIISVQASSIEIRDADALKSALRDDLKPGTILKLAPGDYPGGHHITGIDDLTLEALDPSQPPHFKGGNSAAPASTDSKADGATKSDTAAAPAAPAAGATPAAAPAVSSTPAAPAAT